MLGDARLLTQESLKSVLSYNPNTGAFTWVVDYGYRSKKGNKAGYIQNMGYEYIYLYGKKYLSHRLAFLYMHGSMPNDQVDHINRDRRDNRWENLKESNNVENSKNKAKSKNNKSGVTGVLYRAKHNTWRSMISINGKQINLGSFSNKFDAVCSRKSAEIKHGFHENYGLEIN